MATRNRRTKKTSTDEVPSGRAKKGIRVDFGKEEGGGRRGVRYPEGDYRARITGFKPVTSSEKQTPGINATFKFIERLKGKEISDDLWLTPKSLWRVRALLEAVGVTVPKKALNIDPAKVIGKELGVTVADDDPYEGRIRSRVVDFIDLETLASGDDEDDEDEDDEDIDEDEDTDDEDSDSEDEDDDDDDEDDGLDEMDRTELKAYIKENDLDVKVKKSMDDDDLRGAIRAAEGDDDDEDLEELDLDEI